MGKYKRALREYVEAAEAQRNWVRDNIQPFAQDNRARDEWMRQYHDVSGRHERAVEVAKSLLAKGKKP